MKLFICFFCILTSVLLTSCSSSTQAWEDMKTAGRYMQRNIDALCGKEYESKMLNSDDEFIGPEDGEFIALNEIDLKTSLTASDLAIPQPKGIPGQRGIPMLSAFYVPGDALVGLFQPLHFNTDEFVVREARELQ